MDKTTIGGSIGGWGLIALAIIFGGAGFGAYIDIPSVIIVIGGTIMVTIAQFEGSSLNKVGKALAVAYKYQYFEKTEILIEKIINYATEIKKNGIMTIEQNITDEQNPFFKECFSLLVDNTKPDVIEEIMDNYIEKMEERHNKMITLFSNMGSTAGAMGMIGTLVGLVAMLANLADPSAVGPAMAVALLTTLYGALIGNIFAGIIENKLIQKHKTEMLYNEIVKYSSILIASGESIGNLKMKLNSSLPINMKKNLI